jgi:serine/threonine protein kinase
LLLQGYIHRDIKPDNILFNITTGLFGLIDYGCMMRIDGADYTRGGTPSHVPPEYAVLTGGLPLTYWSDELRKPLSTAAGDVHNVGMVLAEMMNLQLPAELDIDCYEYEKEPEFIRYLNNIRSYDWAVEFEWLHAINQHKMADFLAACLCKDPTKRLTAAEALRMPFLQAVADEVDAAIAAATPGFVGETQAVVTMLEGLRGEDFTFVADQP